MRHALAVLFLTPALAAAGPVVVVVNTAPPVAPAPRAAPCPCPLGACVCGAECKCPVPAAMPAATTVSVTVPTYAGVTSGGSGVVVWAEAGRSLVVTNKHVVADGIAAKMTVKLNATGKVHPCRFLGWSDEGDVALLEVDADLPAARLADADAPVGTAVTHHGNTTGPQTGKVTGYRDVGVPRLGWAGTNLNTDYRSESGDSGAGVFDAAGCLVGIHWGGSPDGSRVRSAIPVRAVLGLLKRFAAPRLPRLAVRLATVTATVAPAAVPAPAATYQPFGQTAGSCSNGSCPAPSRYAPARGLFRR